MPFRYYNAHPYKLSVDDCVKRSISLTTGIPYREVEKGLNQHKKVTGAKIFYQSGNPKSFVENVLGFSNTRLLPKGDGKRETVEEFAKSHPSGRYILSISGHWSACIDGIIYDTWDCGCEKVLSYYSITRFERTRIEKKYCFTVKHSQGKGGTVTVYDGNGNFAVKQMPEEKINEYTDNLQCRGFFNFDEMGDYI